MTWKSIPLGELVTLQRGYDLPNQDRKAGNVPIYGSAGITGYHNIAKAKAPGVLVGRSGASFGVVNFAPEDYWPHNAVMFVTDFHGNHERFVYYLLKNIDFSNYNSGSAQPSLNRNFIYPIPVKVPPLPIQRRIADILSAYDDLIENNARRIYTLEGMAQAIYQEWFGKVDKESLPEGWEIKELQSVDVSIIDGDRGKNYPSKSEFSKDGYCLFLNAGNFKDDRFDYSNADFITEEKNNLLRKGRLQSNDIVLTTRGTIGKIGYFSEKAPYKNLRINSGMVIIRPKSNSLYWYFLLKSPLLKEQYKSFASGSAQPQLPIKDMNQINVLVPPKNIISQFCEIVEPIAEQTEILLRKNTNLRQARDLLLPRLVSGEIAV